MKLIEFHNRVSLSETICAYINNIQASIL